MNTLKYRVFVSYLCALKVWLELTHDVVGSLLDSKQICSHYCRIQILSRICSRYWLELKDVLQLLYKFEVAKKTNFYRVYKKTLAYLRQKLNSKIK